MNESQDTNASSDTVPLVPTASDQTLASVFRVRKCLKFSTRLENGEPFVTVEDPVRSKHFRIGSNGEILQLLEAEHTGDQADALQADQVVQIANWLVAMNLVTVNQSDNADRLNAVAKQSLFNPNRFLKTIQPATEWLFSSWFCLLWVVTGVYSLTLLASNWQRVYSSSAGVFSTDSWLWLLITWFVLKVVHESAHGIACRKYGGEVPFCCSHRWHS